MNSRTRSLTLEALEGRVLLSTCHVTRLSDAGAGMGFSGDLRYCINKVNTEPGPDVIKFVVRGTIFLNGALPALATEIDIQGPEKNFLTIDAQGKSRVFYVGVGAFVSISNLTLASGRADKLSESGFGGAIYNAGGLTLKHCTLQYNSGFRYGGAIYNQGTLWISDSWIGENLTLIHQSYLTMGGGIYNATGGFLLLDRSVVFNNKIEPSYSYTALGGGIANFGQAFVSNSTISDNQAHAQFEATIAGYGGGIFNGRGELLVESSLITRNVAAGDFDGFGGGIANGAFASLPGGKATISNSTIAGNLAYANGDGAGYSGGGGVSVRWSGLVTITGSTISGNSTDGGIANVIAKGGGIFNGEEVLQIGNTIVSDNYAKSGGTDFFGALASSGYNLIENSDGGTGYAPTDLLNMDPLLGPRANNGGPTQTMALLPGSPAIDAGDNSDAPQWDQRGPGFPRIVNGTIDIGAFEVQATGSLNQPDFLAFLITADSDQDE